MNLLMSNAEMEPRDERREECVPGMTVSVGRLRPSAIFDANRDAIREAVRRYPLANPRVFGSVLHRTDTERSDMDILVDVLPAASLFDLGGLEQDLKLLLGVRVDVLTSGFLSKKFRDKVLAEAQPI